MPFDAEDNPFYVFVDYYSGYFVLNAKSATIEAVTTYAESPRDFGRRIRTELLRAEPARGEAPTARRPVVLLASRRPVSPQVAATVARELLNVTDDVCTASMPAVAYVRGAGGEAATATLALIRLPGHAGDPRWTLTTPLGLTAHIDTPPLRKVATADGTDAADRASRLPDHVTPIPDDAVSRLRDWVATRIEAGRARCAPPRRCSTWPLT
jgi:hypothetical protein